MVVSDGSPGTFLRYPRSPETDAQAYYVNHWHESLARTRCRFETQAKPMTSVPSLCTDPRIPPDWRGPLEWLWQAEHGLERRASQLPRAEWRGELKESSACLVVTQPDRPVLLAWSGCLTEECSRLGIDPSSGMIYELSLESVPDLAHVPKIGETIHVSTSHTDSWLVMALAVMQQKPDLGCIHEVDALKHRGFDFTGPFTRQSSHWITAQVIAVSSADDGITLSAEITSVIWNERRPVDQPYFFSDYSIKDPDISPDDPLEQQLTDSDWETRWSAIHDHTEKLTRRQIDRAQRDKKRMVRFAIAKRFDLMLAPAQIDVGLADPDRDVRDIYARRRAIPITGDCTMQGQRA